MTRVLSIVREEWRLWMRSRLAFVSALLFILLLLSTVVLTAVRVSEARHEREHHQVQAQKAFIEQPDRHPHRMVHYGHYVFRTPSPLAVFDPGLDAVTGQAIFLEGHRQNSATFAASAASADLGGMAWLSPALLYQLLAPLLIILLGHGVVAREREAATLTALLCQGVQGTSIIAGKTLALGGAALLMLIPLVFSGVAAIPWGASLGAVALLFSVYVLYLAIWVMLCVLVSTLVRKSSTALAVLVALWLAGTLLLPSLAVNHTASSLPIAGQIETSLTMLKDLRQLGDGHNAADPAFEKLREDLLAKHGVDTVDALPVNLRGVIAQYSEAQLTETLNAYAEERMAREQEQAAFLSHHGWFTPFLAVGQASRAIAATDLSNHQRFLREAEALRFEFVQGLNRVHAEELSYSDDVNRGNDEEAAKRARVSADNWAVLRAFEFQLDSVGLRLHHAAPSFVALLLWCAVLFALSFLFARRISL